jgi:hypothetical protein
MVWFKFLRRSLGRAATLLLVCAACEVALLGVAFEAAAQTTSERGKGDLLGSGKSLFEDQRYEESIQTLSAALLRPGTSKEDRIEIYRFLAFNYLVLSQTEEAEAAVRGLYVIEPDFKLEASESPRFRVFFEDVKKRWEAEGRPGATSEAKVPAIAPTIKHASPSEWESGKQLRVTGEVVDPGGRAAAVTVHYRTGSRGKFLRLDARHRQGRFRATVPAAAVKPPLVEYYIEVVDDAGLPISTRGDAAAPMRIAIPDPDAGGTVLSSPWFWVATAVVVGGGVTGALLLSRDSQSGGGTVAPTPPATSRVIVVIGP